MTQEYFISKQILSLNKIRFLKEHLQLLEDNKANLIISHGQKEYEAYCKEIKEGIKSHHRVYGNLLLEAYQLKSQSRYFKFLITALAWLERKAGYSKKLNHGHE